MSNPSRPRRLRTADAVLALVKGGQGVTRGDLVDRSGLSPSTVGHTVSRLLEEGVIVETVQEKGPGTGSGRPAHILTAVPSGIPVGAIDFGHEHIRVALGDDSGTALDETLTHIDVDLRAHEALDLACRALTDLMQSRDVDRLATVVAGIPGPVDRDTGIVCSPTILSSWMGLTPRAELESRLNTPVHIENDAVLGAFGELRRGAGRQHQDFLYVKSSHGVGAALVIDGKIYRGSGGLAGEIGHSNLPGRSELCRCGNRGCLEAVVTVTSVLEEIAFTHPHLDPALITLISTADPVTGRILEQRGWILGGVLANLCNLLNPSAVIIGGALGTTGTHFIEGVRTSVQRYTQPAIAAGMEIKATQLGGRAELVGALEMAGDLARL